MSDRLPKAWMDFLHELDASLSAPAELHCLGGFVIDVVYRLPRISGTSDIDVLFIGPRAQRDEILSLAGKGSPLLKKHGLYIDFIPSTPVIVYEYESRLRDAFEGRFKNLSLKTLDPYDVALSKIGRNSRKDREDVKQLARAVPFDLDLLQCRYKSEVRPYVNNAEREDLTLKLWIEMIEEERAR